MPSTARTNSEKTGSPKANTSPPNAKQTDPVDETSERIRQLNEQVLNFGRTAGIAYLEAYEAALKTFADYQDEFAGSMPNESLSSLARAQANFTREVVQAFTSSARGFLK
jgi:hypothetical protein